MPLQNILITASINSIATQSYGQRTYIASTDEQSFPIEEITGSRAGAWPNFVPNTNYTIDLVTNITQSWTDSNVTSLGIISYTHNTMEEFINGEFSGSEYTVTNGSLIDAQCEQFLTVNTTPVAYSVFPYSSIFTKTRNSYNPINYSYNALPIFLNTNTAPHPGQLLMHYNAWTIQGSPGTTYNNITYLKIARVDQYGNDNTLSLQELTSIRWTDSTAGLIDLTVLNIAEYPDYYLYEVSSKVWVNLLYYADDNALDYSFSASNSTTLSVSASPPNYAIPYNIYVSGSGVSKFNTSYLEISLTENFKSSYTASITATNYNATPATFSYAIFETDTSFINYSAIASTNSVALAPSQTKTFTLTGSYQFFGTPAVYYTEINNLDYPISLSNTFWIITQSQLPQTSTSSVVLEPYLLSTFTDSDCDVLMNNYSQNDTSQYVRRVLYDAGSTIPSNLDQIINGTAEYAEMNDYIYTANANKIPRYEGVRTTSQNFNLPSQNGLTNEQLANIDKPSALIINNGTPNVENTTTYFAYFSELKSNNPIFKGTTSPVIKYLIREDGSTYSPSTDNISYYNLVGSFPRGTKAYANLLYEASTTFNSTQSIILSGESYTPILYNIKSANASVAAFTSSLNFDNLQGITSNTITPPSYSIYIQKIGSTNITSTPTNPFFETGSISYNPNNSWIGDYFNPVLYQQSYNFNSAVPISVKVTFQITNLYVSSSAGPTIILAKLYTRNSSTGITTLRTQKQSSTFGGYSSFPTFNNYYQYENYYGGLLRIEHIFTPDPDDLLYVTFERIGGNGGNNSNLNVHSNAFYLKIEPLGVAIPQIGPIFWTTGSSNSTSITSSIELGSVLQGNYRQIDIENSGFDPIQLPCTINIGDEFRFEYDEANTYRVIDTYFSETPNLITTASLLNFNVTPLYNQVLAVGSSSFTLNGSINFILTGSAPPYTNTSTNIYLTGSTSATNAASQIVLAINNSASVAPYSASISDISASSTTTNLNLYAITPGDIGNYNYLTSGSTLTYFSGGSGVVGLSPVQLVLLDRPIPNISTLNINHFTVRRKIRDAITGIAFNANSLDSIQDGFLLPEYPSHTIQNNISNIIQDLIQKGVI